MVMYSFSYDTQSNVIYINTLALIHTHLHPPLFIFIQIALVTITTNLLY